MPQTLGDTPCGPGEKPPRPERLALGLAGLAERACEFDPAAASSPVHDVLFGGMWFVARLACGACGRAFVFTGAHEVYGPFELDVFQGMRHLVGMPARDALAWALSNAAVAELGPHVAASLAVALVNAVAAPRNGVDALRARGLELLGDPVAELVRPQDHVAVVGAGMFMDELRAAHPAMLDIVDLRPACDLMCARVSAAGVETAPDAIRFHTTPDDTAELFAAADVLFITGCTLVNATFFELMALPRRARDVVLFGPSACGPFEALAELGVTCVAGSEVLDGDALATFTMAGLAARRLSGEVSRPYTMRLPRV